MKLSQAEINDLLAKGAVIGPPARMPTQVEGPEPKEAKLIEPGISLTTIAGIRKSKLYIDVAYRAESETNTRGHWSKKSKRTQAARNAVRAAVGHRLDLLEPFARHYASGGALRVVFTRIGGKRLDEMSNLGASMKAVEDAIAYLLGCNDGDPRWHARAEQEPGTGPVGVRITVEEWK